MCNRIDYVGQSLHVVPMTLERFCKIVNALIKEVWEYTFRRLDAKRQLPILAIEALWQLLCITISAVWCKL